MLAQPTAAEQAAWSSSMRTFKKLSYTGTFGGGTPLLWWYEKGWQHGKRVAEDMSYVVCAACA